MSPAVAANGEGSLSAERILVAAEDALRRFGPAKATVVDVARALGVSHAAVYRHFKSKADLRDAVLARWLERVSGPLGAIARDETIAPAERLWTWFGTLRALKRERALGDPELFATYHALAGEARDVVTAHVAELEAQIETIVRAGMANTDFRAGDAGATARALLSALTAFHHPVHAATWGTARSESDYAAVCELLGNSLRPR